MMYGDVTSEDERKWLNAILFILLKQAQDYFNIINKHLITLLKSLLEDAHSVHAGSSSSRLTHSSFFFLLHVASLLAGS
jgi:hypothetical protein